MAQTLMFDMHVPKQYWAYIILTACYLINHAPSSLLNNQVPFSMLHSCVSPFPLPPRVFRCVVFVHNLEPNQVKLAPRYLKCVFLCYPRTQKAIVVTVLSHASIMSVQMLPSLSPLHSILSETILLRSHQI